MVSFQSGNRQLEGYLARIEGEGPFPALVLIHEASGLNENMDTLKDVYNEAAAQDSWERVLAFFGERLGAKAEA
jgi:dienelactone hydrolase